jgi:hypothetical protein
VKKLISIGIALALLAIAIVPVAVAAQTDCAYDTPDDYPVPYIEPATYAKIPFAIIESGLAMVGGLMGDLGPILEAAEITLPLDLAQLSPIFYAIGGFAGGPLSWTVDMMGWGLGMLSPLLAALETADLGLPAWLTDVVDAIVCHIFAPFECVTGTSWAPCGTL